MSRPDATPPATRLGRRAAAEIMPPVAPSRATRLALAVASGPLASERVVLPRLGPAWVKLAAHAHVQAIEAAVFQEMERLKLPLSHLTALSYEAERAVRTLAIAVFDPDDPALLFGTFEEWQALDQDIIAAAWQVYGDVRERLSPLDATLTREELDAIQAAIAKKNSSVLRSFGVSKLAAFAITTADPPSS